MFTPPKHLSMPPHNFKFLEITLAVAQVVNNKARQWLMGLIHYQASVSVYQCLPYKTHPDLCHTT